MTGTSIKEGKKIVMVVDDSPLIIDRLAKILSRIDNVGKLLNAGSYLEAVNVLDQQVPDIAILDINLNGESGIALLRLIRDRKLSIDVVMLTNQVSEEYEIICRKLGAKYFLDKSKDFDQIPAIISSAV